MRRAMSWPLFGKIPRLRVLHQPEPIPVNDNWNTTLNASQGEYVLQIGNDKTAYCPALWIA